MRPEQRKETTRAVRSWGRSTRRVKESRGGPPPPPRGCGRGGGPPDSPTQGELF
jgi:hypothetical protein